jgi:hypothetical protein
MAGTAALRHLDLPAPLRYAIPVVPLVIGWFYLRATMDDLRRQLDELILRMYLETAAVVVIGLFAVILSYPLFQAAQLVGPMDYPVVLALMAVLTVIGFTRASRRYR